MTNSSDQWRRFAPFALSAVLLTVAVAGNLASAADQMSRSGQAVALYRPLIDELTSATAWLAVLPIIAWAFTRFVPPRTFLPQSLSGHAVLIPLVSLTHYGLARLLRALLGLFQGEGLQIAFSWGGYVADLYKDVLTYLLFGIVYAGTVRLLRRRMETRGADIAAASPTLEVRDGAQTAFIPLIDIFWIEGAGNYAQLHTRSGRIVLMRTTLARLTERLDGAGFLRIHRSRLVNLAAVTGVENLPAGDAVLRLSSGATILASRRYRSALLTRLSTYSNGDVKGI